jgi:Holliday junction resolvasome RuvABC endonuclease subunit
LGHILGIQAVPKEPDAVDAVAVAVCHLQQSKLRGMISSSVGAR